jgi:hypothetical protein
MRKKAGIKLTSQKRNLETEHESEVEAGLRGDAPGGAYSHQGDNGGEEKHERAQAVDAEVIFDAQAGHPGRALDIMHAAVSADSVPDEEGEGQGEERTEKGDDARIPAGDERDAGGRRWNRGEDGEQRLGHRRTCPAPAPMTNARAARISSPKASARR